MVQRKRQDSNLQLLAERLLSKQFPFHSARFLDFSIVRVGFEPTIINCCVKAAHWATMRPD